MLFYKIDVELLHSGIEPERSERAERAAALQSKIEVFFIERERNCHIAVSNIMYKKKKAVLCAAVKNGSLTNNTIAEFINPGLRSRIAFHVPFADYNADELCMITELMADNKKMKLGNGVREKLLPIYETAMKTGDFGNGRFARNIFEKAVMKQASRLVLTDVDNVTDAEIKTLIADDFETPLTVKKEVRRIGFSC